MLVLHAIAHGLGYVATIAFFIQYVPQIHLNYKRKTCEGFSSVAILVKLIGASFMFINFLLDEKKPPWSVVIYALINVGQYSVLIIQFVLYNHRWMYCSYFLVIPTAIITSFALPATMAWTNSIKPATQVISQIALLAECVRIKSTRGVSLMSMHFNGIGGAAGTIMCIILSQRLYTLMLYVNSFGQAVSIYVLAAMYDWNWNDKDGLLAKDEADGTVTADEEDASEDPRAPTPTVKKHGSFSARV
eukprot:TRINITY_DN67146_c4_g2_i1.p1 TRINITY_DN67146_c4_g2~~TRINITY_DN67146_c4_g2_i1.p1  ORF type:complete len:246 (-),score=5.03 TRINITY_DN67146_c4_g2_i1:203-940(-)